MMRAHRTMALIPVKPLGSSKSRLAQELSPAERQELTLNMLRTVLGCIREVPAITGWAVISADSDALAMAREHGGSTVIDAGNGLNHALDQGRAWALAHGAEAILILHADLPLLRTQDIVDLLALGDSQTFVVLAPSKDAGTNALYLKPPDVIPLRFGQDSAALHEAEGVAHRLPVTLFVRDTVAFDLDTPSDLHQYLQHNGSSVYMPLGWLDGQASEAGL